MHILPYLWQAHTLLSIARQKQEFPMKAEAWAQSRQRTGTEGSRGGLAGWGLHLIAMIIARITAPASRKMAMAINDAGSPSFRYVASEKAMADAAYSVHAACRVVGLFIGLLVFIFYLLYCSEYLVGYLRHNRIA